MLCHICLMNRPTTIVKCKLCCDGLEQDVCGICGKIYDEMKHTYSTDKARSKECFEKLQVMRNFGIRKERLTNGR